MIVERNRRVRLWGGWELFIVTLEIRCHFDLLVQRALEIALKAA